MEADIGKVLFVLSFTVFTMGDQISHQMVKRIHGPALDNTVNHGYLGYQHYNQYPRYPEKSVKYSQPPPPSRALPAPPAPAFSVGSYVDSDSTHIPVQNSHHLTSFNHHVPLAEPLNVIALGNQVTMDYAIHGADIAYPSHTPYEAASEQLKTFVHLGSTQNQGYDIAKSASAPEVGLVNEVFLGGTQEQAYIPKEPLQAHQVSQHLKSEPSTVYVQPKQVSHIQPAYHVPKVKPMYHVPAPVYTHAEPVYHVPEPYVPEPVHPAPQHKYVPVAIPEPDEPYSYAYEVNDDYMGTNLAAAEERDEHFSTNGEYKVSVDDGRVQHVVYHSDDYSGYKAEVEYRDKNQYFKRTRG